MKHIREMVEIEGEEIIIRIPIGAFPVAVPVACDRSYEYGNHAIRVTNTKAFARELAAVLRTESETGETLVTDMLDQAVFRAVEDGAEGVEGPPL